jgi:hypothetical protein
MTDNAQQGNNLSSSAQGAPKPTGDKPEGTEAGELTQGAARKAGTGGRAIGAPRTSETDPSKQGASSARAAFQGDHPQRSSAVRERVRDPRGAGSGENANATRGRNLVDWPPEPMTHAEHVEELLEIAQENEDYNKAVNEAQTAVTAEALGRVGFATYPLGDPKLEEESRQQVLDEFVRANDPKARAKTLDGEMEARAKRDQIQAEKMYGRTESEPVITK